MKTTQSSAICFGLLLAASTATGATISGAVEEVASNIVHPNGNIYDQVLLRGATGSVQADPGQVIRLSFLDLTDDIVQVEFSGKGTLTVSLENASGPMSPAKYDQPGVEYMRGHASITISGTDATTNVSVFSVGRITAVNQGLFRVGVTYDGFADIAGIEIVAEPHASGVATAFGGIRAGNAHFFATRDFTGIYAPDVDVQGPVTVGDISAEFDATPMLWFGEQSQFGEISVAGGDLFQPNGQPLQMKGFQSIRMLPGTSSIGIWMGRQLILGSVVRDGFDVTNAVVLYPAYPAIPVATTGATSAVVGPGTAIAVTNAVAAVGSTTNATAGAVGSTAPVHTVPVTPVDPVVVVQPGGG